MKLSKLTKNIFIFNNVATNITLSGHSMNEAQDHLFGQAKLSDQMRLRGPNLSMLIR